jgi:ABC-2 type transport system ATP-binding protein
VPPDVTATIEVQQLTKMYGAARGVIDFDLEVVPGEVHGFLGPNGAGKSTTIRVILDFHRATSGSVQVFGHDSRRDSVAIRRRLGFLSSDLRLFDHLTATQHLAWFSKARGGHDEGLARELTDRFDIALERPIKELSKGNRQKVGLLLAFVHRPELLILDEPTTGLDPLMQAEFDHLVRETAAEGRTVLLSSHSLDEVQRVADRVTIIKDGKLVITDSVDHLRESAPRVMHLRFAAPVEAAAFAALESVANVRGDGDTLTLDLTGPIAPVLGVALRHGVVDLSARPADLDELFLSYYADGAEADR